MHDRDELPAALRRAVEEMRAEPEVRAEWRSALLDRAEQAGVERRVRTSHVRLTWPMAVAAGFACALIGAGTLWMMDRRAPPAVSATAPTTTEALPVRFSLVAPNAVHVSLVGDFNHWNPATLPMRRSSDGRGWEVEVRLPLGRYSYSFLVDGKLAADPSAPSGGADDFGSSNSVLMVRKS